MIRFSVLFSLLLMFITVGWDSIACPATIVPIQLKGSSFENEPIKISAYEIIFPNGSLSYDKESGWTFAGPGEGVTPIKDKSEIPINDRETKKVTGILVVKGDTVGIYQPKKISGTMGLGHEPNMKKPFLVFKSKPEDKRSIASITVTAYDGQGGRLGELENSHSRLMKSIEKDQETKSIDLSKKGRKIASCGGVENDTKPEQEPQARRKKDEVQFLTGDSVTH